jgi:RNA polymerase sigma-70 factor (ECF subfamily)
VLIDLMPWLERQAHVGLRNPDLAQDAVADTLLAGLSAPPPWRDAGRIKAWLGGVLRNKMVDQLRSFGPMATVVADQDAVDGLADSRIGGCEPAAELERRQFLQALSTALAELPPRQAEIFVMREVGGVTTEAICAQMSITPGHCWVMSHRGRHRLQGLLQAWRPEGC